MAVETARTISADDFRTLNRCLDDAIAGAVTQYGHERDASDIAAGKSPGLAHELRILNNTALVAFDALKGGCVGVSGSTGAVLQRSLIGIGALIDRALAEMPETAAGGARLMSLSSETD